MKNLFLVLASLGFSIQSFADACGAKSVQYGKDKIELMQIKQKPETTADGQTIKGSEDVLVTGIYMFVRSGTNWNVYRCADDKVKPVFNAKKCILKNDFYSNSQVKRNEHSSIVVRNTDDTKYGIVRTGRNLQIRLNAASSEDLNYYDIKATEKGLEVIENQFKADNEQPSSSVHKPVNLGVCKPDQKAEAAVKKTGIPAKKIDITN